MGEEPRHHGRSLKIRRTVAPAGDGIHVTADQLAIVVDAAVEKSVAPIRKRLESVTQDVHSALHVLLEMRSILQLSVMDEDHAATKARLNELVEGLLASTERLAGSSYASDKMDSNVSVEMRPATSVLGSYLGRNSNSYEEEGDDLIENASESVDDEFGNLY